MKEPIPDIHYETIKCCECDDLLAKFFRDCEGCFVKKDFYVLCVECWEQSNAS